MTISPERQQSAIDGRTTRHPGYAISGRRRKRIEEIFGWTKATAGLRKTRHHGVARVGWIFTVTAAAYNLVLYPAIERGGIAMTVLRCSADHAAKTPFESRSDTAISAIMACFYTTYSKITFCLLRFSVPV